MFGSASPPVRACVCVAAGHTERMSIFQDKEGIIFPPEGGKV